MGDIIDSHVHTEVDELIGQLQLYAVVPINLKDRLLREQKQTPYDPNSDGAKFARLLDD